jgi:transcriptional regulator with XRE-family HTH domain
MDALRLGAVFRAVRVRKGWRQIEVARRAGVSRATVSRAERGRTDELMANTLFRIALALDVRLDWVARWRGGELDRMLNAGHAAMHEGVARTLRGQDWVVAPETTFAIYGERGAIDVLAFHPPSGALLVVELKTDIVDVNGLIGAVDRYRRLAPGIARNRGWHPTSVSCWVAVRDTPTNRRRVRAHASVLRAAFPDDGRRMRAWLRRPAGAVSALAFLSDAPNRSISAASSGVQRVRRRGPSVAGGRDKV